MMYLIMNWRVRWDLDHLVEEGLGGSSQRLLLVQVTEISTKQNKHETPLKITNLAHEGR
ncbi:hypothetical protein LguiA_001311 [Lonicera macranthoides]